MRRSILALAVGALLLGPGAAAGAEDAPRAQAAGKCGTVRTVNGGTAKYVFANRVSCRIARQVAKRARGRAYRASGFRCRIDARLYSCNSPGTFRGIGFSYERP